MLSDMQFEGDKIALDLETTGLTSRHNEIFSIQIGTGKNNYLIDLQEGNYVFDEVRPYLEGMILVGHNITFDLKFLYMKGFYPDKVYDTMIASKLYHNGKPPFILHSFGAVMERELGVYYDKSEQKNIHKIRLSTQKAIQYCFNDVDRLLELESDLLGKLTSFGVGESYEINCNYIRALAYMENCGLPIDEVYWKDKMQNDLANSKEREQEIIEYIYNNLPKFRKRQLDLFHSKKELSVSLTSPVQMIKVFEAFGISVMNDDGKKSINETVISKSKHEFVKLWLKYQEAQHRVTTFGQNILDKAEEGRLYTSFNPIVDTCRISSRRGEINFLNFPSDKETRKCFRAKDGFNMIDADFSNQEMCCLADNSMDTATIKTITEGIDAHCLLAKEVYPELKSLTDKEIKEKHNDKRQIGKVANFTVNNCSYVW